MNKSFFKNKFLKSFFLFLILELLSSNLYGCGCKDSDSAFIFINQAKNHYDSSDIGFANDVEKLNSELNSTFDLLKTKDYLLNRSSKIQKIYLYKSAFTLENRKMINAAVQEGLKEKR